MTLTFLNNSAVKFAALCFVLLIPAATMAQGTVSLSVSPTLFEMSANPSQKWSSNIRVINTNSFPLKVYVNAVNFEPSGESGQGTMRPVLEAETEGLTLAEWITLPPEEVVIPAEQTVSVPFSITVPEGASPGGHFAAILVGTRSLTDTDAPAQVQTSQIVTSLVFLTVAGDIIERGSIRDFTTDKSVSESLSASFYLRFENSGNVHLRPQGDIVIKNMWGKERGVIPINKASQFGNVLPESIRKYNFEWTGDFTFGDIGRYTAVATIGYGDSTKQFVSSKTSFWVIPWRTLAVMFVVLGGLLWLIVWGIKLYVRKMLLMAGVTPELQRATKHKRTVSFTAPLEESILDLRADFHHGEGLYVTRLIKAVKKYKLPILVLAAVVILVFLLSWFLLLALSAERDYEVLIEQEGQMVPLPTELDIGVATDGSGSPDSQVQVLLINRSGLIGLETIRASELKAKNYSVELGQQESGSSESRTVIVYDPKYETVAVELQSHFTNSLLSSFVSENQTEAPITIYLGSDQI